jgi:hypothetical protein
MIDQIVDELLMLARLPRMTRLGLGLPWRAMQ